MTLSGIGARLKSALGGHLSYEDMFALVEPLILTPPLPSQYRVVADKIWENGQPFDVIWREHGIKWRLRDVAAEPTRELQLRKLKGQLLDCAELVSLYGIIDKLGDEEAAVILEEWPDRDRGPNMDVGAKRPALATQFLGNVLTYAVLLELAKKAHGLDADEFDHWVALFQESYRFLTGIKFNIRTAHVSDPETFTPEIHQYAISSAQDMFKEMDLMLEQIRHGIVAGSLDVEGFRAKYNAMVRARDEQYLAITGQETARDDQI